MTNTTKLNRIWTATIFIVAVALLLTTFAVVFAPVSNPASAEVTYGTTLKLTTNVESEMQVGDEISVKAHVTDQSLADCTVQWECYVNGILIESVSGWDFGMTVPKMAGDYVIYATLYDGSTQKAEEALTFRVVEWGRDWQEIYDDFTDDIRDDWYYDEQYLDLYNAIVEVQNMLNDSIFDRDALKEDPIIIASIETGISSGYIKSSGSRAGLTAMFINPVEVEYVLHPIFEDVLLKDENGDYVYYLSTPTFKYQPKKTGTDPNPSLVTYYWNNTGDIAKDMVSVDDHGIGVTGVMAYLIHQFGLEDYIKILPIKADSAYVRNENNQIVTRYDMNTMNDAVRYAKEAGADIVNASFGGSADNNLYGAYGDSIIVVGAAGNDNEMAQHYPAGFENVLGVMDYSRDKDGNVVLYGDASNSNTGSNYGEWYDVATPGEDLVTPCYGNHISYTASYKQMHGASAAAPVASFASALALFRYRGYNSYGTGIEITPRIAREMIPYCTDKVATKDVGNGVVYEYPALDFNAVLTYEFLKDGEFMNSVGIHASGYFGALSNAKDVEEVGNTILLRAMAIVEDGKYDSIDNATWYYRLDGIEYTIGTGNEINFVIPEEGDYDIYYVLTVWKGSAYDLRRSAELIEFSVPKATLPLPEKVTVTSNLQANYKVDSGKSVTFTATIGADEYTEDTPYWWGVVDGKYTFEIGSGWSVDYQIPTTAGSYQIFCALVDENGVMYAQSTDTLAFTVSYYEPQRITIYSNAKGEYKVDTTDKIMLSAVVSPANSYTDGEFAWFYLSEGNKYHFITTGFTAELQVPQEVGTYRINCGYRNSDGAYYLLSSNPIDFTVTNYAPESISVSADIESEYKVDTAEVVTLSATINPTLAVTEDTLTWWYELGGIATTIGTGATVEFSIPNVAGEYTVYCALVDNQGNKTLVSTDAISFVVSNYAPESITLTSNVTGEYRVDKSYNATFSATVNPTNAVFDGTIVWCYELDGNVVEFGDGASVTISIPHVVGRYTVYCVIFDDNDNIILQSNSVAFNVAESVYDWEEDYQNYLDTYANANGGADADWYFDEQYLDIYNAIVELQTMLSDPNFDKASLMADPIVIAVIEPGFSVAFSTDEYGYLVEEVGFGHTIIEKNPNTAFRMHPIFEDVILTDANGNCVYANLATDIVYTDRRDGTVINYTWENNGDIAHDLVSFDDHGVAVGGIIAYLIHQFGVEDYVKIMPIKAGDSFWMDDKGVFQRGFSAKILEEALQWAYDNGADIVNASYGTADSQLYKKLADEILIVGAAGNTNQIEHRYPSGFDNVLGVMNYVKDGNGNLVLYDGTAGSTYGEWYDIAAPGENLVIPCYGATLDSIYSYKVMGGTSSSTPVAAFASALAVIRYRGYDNYGVDIELTPDVIKNMIPYCSDQVATKKDGNVTYSYPALDFKNVLTYDFYGDQDFLELIGVSTVIDVTSNAESIHYLGDTISLNATIATNGLFQDEQPYWWYQLDGKANAIGYGWNINFTIPNQAGEYEIYCTLSNNESGLYIQGNDTILLTAYAKVDALSVVASVESEYKVETNAVVTLSATIGADEYTADTPYWWGVIDGKYTFEIGSGWTVEFAIPNAIGEYTIYCALVNASGVKTLVSTDTISFAVTNYVPESIAVSVVDHNGVSVTFTATINPTNAVTDDTLVWMCKVGTTTTEVGTGATLDFVLPTEPGTYTIYCVLKDSEGNITLSNSNTLSIDVLDYSPKSTTINTIIDNEYMIDTTTVVTLTATTNPSNYKTEDALTWWYEVGGKETIIGTGATVEFAIPGAVGNYVVKCAYVGKDGVRYAQSTNALTFAVIYYAPEDVDVEVVETFDKAVHYAIPENLLDPTVVDGIEWYLNGILVATGADYTCTLIMPGEYVITVVVDGQERQVATHTVEDTTPTPPVTEGEPTTPPTQEEQTPTVDENDDNGAKTALIATSSVLGSSTLGFGAWALALLLKKKRKIV